MRIGIDARFWGPSGTGLGKYIEKLILNLEKIDQQNEYFIFLRRENFTLFTPQNKNFHKVLADFRWYSIAEQMVFPFMILQQKLDLMHFGHFNVPLIYSYFSPIFFPKYVVTIHDLIKHEFSTQASTTRTPLIYWLKHLVYRLVFAAAINRTQKILVPSNWVKNLLIKQFHLSENKICITCESGDMEFQQPISQSKLTTTLKKYHLKRPFLIYVGNVYPYKNLEKLLLAFKILKEKPQWQKLKLIIGCTRNIFLERLLKEIKTYGLAKEVITPGFIPGEDLVYLYQAAETYVFPSLSEGFGIPGLDAMIASLPVVSSNSSCLPEIYGDAAYYFDPHDKNDIAQKIGEVLINENLRENLIEKGRQRAKMFSWPKMARETLKFYKETK